MKKHILLILSIFLLLSTDFLLAQEAENADWQQEVNYTIEVSLDDEQHQLTGFIQMEYHNNSPNDLTFIYLHLWPNAYKNDQTAFAQQQLENGSTEFYFSKQSQRGGIEGLDFKTDEGDRLLPIPDDKHPDIVKLELDEPLKSGEKLSIGTPFMVKVPNSFSRLGHVEQSYQITQWYPKPAVYDAKGWHPMPYLDQGEFYSEFGSFDVKITVPKNYVLGATGDLQNEEERAWLLEKAAQSLDNLDINKGMEFPKSAIETKTLHYKQDNIHDFAWFADKRYLVRMDSITLPNSGRTVDAWAMFLPENAQLWSKGIDYIKDGTLFYSKYVGDYPYNQVTAVDGALSAGGGMEYPTITVIGQMNNAIGLETVIVHEVGHNWFYGILGSNERAYAWMDEGINSYYEKRYFEEKYPDKKLLGQFAKSGLAKFLNVADYKSKELDYYSYLFQARQHKDQPIEIHSEKYSMINYFSSVYGKAALAFNYLETYLGQKRFDALMQKYYQQYQFKHPQPKDIRQLFENETGKYLDWFFDELLVTNKPVDYHIKKVQLKGEKIGKKTFDLVTLKNKYGNVRGPFTLSAIKNDSIKYSRWYDGFSGEMEVLFPSGDYEALTIDAQQVIPETNRQNNTYRLKGLFKKRPPLRLQPLGSLENPKRKQLFFSPILGYNHYDKLMLGIGFYNSLFPRKNLEYSIAPMYTFGSKGFAGMGQVAYTWYLKKGLFHHLRFNVAGSTFTHGNYTAQTSVNRDLIFDKPFRFYKIAPEVQARFREPSARSSVQKSVKFRHVNIQKSNTDCPSDTINCFTNNNTVKYDYYVNELSFNFKNKRAVNPYQFTVFLEQSDRFIKTSLEANYRFTYANKRRRGMNVRLFAGAFLQDDLQALVDNDFKFNMSALKGKKDYLFDHTYLGRVEGGGFLGAQVNPMRSGGFKLRTDQSGGNEVGLSDNWLAAINLDVDMPVDFLPLSVYANFGFHDPKELSGISEQFVYDIGATLKLIPNTVEVYFPILHSNDYKNAVDANTDNYFQKISFFINFHNLNPISRVRALEF